MPKSSLDILRELANRLNEYPPGYTPTQEQAAGQDKEKERWRRLFGTLATSVYGVNPNTGKVAAPFDTETGDIIAPGLVDQTLALPAWFQPVGKALGWNYDPPQWSKDAEKNSDQVLDEIRDRMNYGPPTDTGDYAIESAATMLAQPLAKVGSIDELKAPFRAAGNWAKGALSRFGPAGKVAGHAANATTLPIRAGLEFFGPAIEPSAKNYALGTAFGTGLRSMLGDPEAEQIEYIQKKLEAGKLTQEEAEDKIIALLQSGDKLSEPNNEVPPVTMSKAKGGKIRNLNAARTELKSVLESLYGYIADRVSLDDFDDAISEIQERVKSPALRAELLNVVKRAQSTEDFRTAYPDLNAIAQRYGIPAGEDAHLSMQREGGLGKALEESPPEEPAPHSAPPTTEDELWAMFSRGELSSLEFEDLARQLEKNPPPKKAKGGKIKTGTLLALRQKLASLLGEAGVEGTGKEMVPVDPLPTETNLPSAPDVNLPDAEFTRPPAETNLPPEQALDKLANAQVSRRTVLRGLASLANPLPIDPSMLLKSTEQPWVDEDLLNQLRQAVAKAPEPPKSILGVIARMNDREGYERGAWGPTAAHATRALIDQLMDSGEHDDIHMLLGSLDEFGVEHQYALDTDLKSQLEDPFEDLMANLRGYYAGTGESTQHGVSRPSDLLEDLKDPKSSVTRELETYAEGSGEDFEDVKKQVTAQLKHEDRTQLIHDPEGLEASDPAMKTFFEIKRDGDLIEDRREYDIEDLKKAYPELKWSDAVDLHSLIHHEFEAMPNPTEQTADMLQNTWDFLQDGSEDSPEILAGLAKKLKKTPGLESLVPIVKRAANLENSDAAGMSTRSKAFKEYERAWEKIRTDMETTVGPLSQSLGLRMLGSGKMDINAEPTRFGHLSAEHLTQKLQDVHDAIFDNPDKPNFKKAKKAIEGVPNADDVEIDLDAYQTDRDSNMHEEIPDLYDTWRHQLKEELTDLADYHELPYAKFRPKPKKRKK